jgi:hypothetical protein
MHHFDILGQVAVHCLNARRSKQQSSPIPHNCRWLVGAEALTTLEVHLQSTLAEWLIIVHAAFTITAGAKHFYLHI